MLLVLYFAAVAWLCYYILGLRAENWRLQVRVECLTARCAKWRKAYHDLEYYMVVANAMEVAQVRLSHLDRGDAP